MSIHDFAGFGIRGFRSFGGAMQYIGPMSKVHLVAGRNNVGKSNLLRALKLIATQLATTNAIRFNEIFPSARDTPEGWSPLQQRSIAIALNVNQNLTDAFAIYPEEAGPSLLDLFKTDAFSKGQNGVVWFEYDLVPDAGLSSMSLVPAKAQIELGLSQAPTLDESWLSNLALRHLHQASGVYDNWLRLMQRWNPRALVPPFEWVEAKRSVGAAETRRGGDPVNSGFRTGRGFIPELLALQSPETENYQRDRPKFEAFEKLVQAVLEDPDARISVSGSGSDLQITTNGRFESYKDLGTGLTEIVQIAAMATSVSGHIISIEEPEIHLHPTLQRLLVTYLAEKTDNHYVISTHSASMLDAEVASVSHVHTDDDGWSAVRAVALRRDRAAVVADLGNRASDLVQSNYVIWVEGPSDRIYLSAWLRSLAPELVEGVNFSIMFYGGGLLSHLTAKDDDEVTSFIELAQINRNFTIVIDSDISRVGQEINETKQRVVAELTASGGFAWVTDGYTIENYVPADALERAIRVTYPNKTYTVPSGRYDSPLGAFFEGETVKPNKVTVARGVVQSTRSFGTWRNDLRPHIERVVRGIRLANALPDRAIEWS